MQFQLARPNSRHKPLNDAIRLANRGFLELAIFGKFLADRRQLPLRLGQYGLYRTIHRFSLRETGRFPNLVACADINDFANWIKLFDQDPLIVQCSDKLAARDYVAAKVGPDILTKIFQIHEHFSEIDFDVLPKSFVIKTNNDSGTVIIVPDKDKLDRAEAGRRVERALSSVYGAAHGEWAYAHITPKVFVEESLASADGVPPLDHRFFAADGKVGFAVISYGGRDPRERRAILVDTDGRDTGLNIGGGIQFDDYPLPANWTEMIEVAEKLAADFKMVRVDLYSAGGGIRFGELTFWPNAGAMTGPDIVRVAPLIDFDRTTFKPPYRPRQR